MRSETEMMELILEGARQDQRVIAAYLKGSRTNPNVPKDPYAMAVYHTQARPVLEQMLEWYVGCETGFSLSCGKRTGFFQQYLPEELYEAFTHTYAAGSFQALEDSIHSARQLFRKTALLVADRLSFSYPDGTEEGFLRYQQLMSDIAETETR